MGSDGPPREHQYKGEPVPRTEIGGMTSENSRDRSLHVSLAEIWLVIGASSSFGANCRQRLLATLGALSRQGWSKGLTRKHNTENPKLCGYMDSVSDNHC